MDSWCEWLTPYFTIPIINNSSTNLVTHSHTIIIIIISMTYTFVQFYPLCVWWSSSGLRPPASDGGCMPAKCPLQRLCEHITILCSCIHKPEVKSLDYPGQDQLLNCPSGAPQPLAFRCMHAFTPSYCSRDADSVASLQSTPSRVQYCLYSESGLFWAIS